MNRKPHSEATLQKMRSSYANKTPEEKEAIAEKIRTSYAKRSQEAETERNRKHSETLAKRTSEERTEYSQNLSKLRSVAWDNMTPAERAETSRRIGAASTLAHANHSQERKSEIAKKLSIAWVNLTTEEKAKRRQKTDISKHYTLKDGRILKVDSSWEGALYQYLLDEGIKFDYTNESEDANLTDLRTKTWFPDFVIPDLQLIIEVKGHPKATEKFFEVDLPAIRIAKISYRVALLRYNLDRSRPKDWDDFLANWLEYF